MKNAMNETKKVSSLHSLEMANEIEDTANRIFNNAGASEHGYIDAAIYLSKGAEEIRNAAYQDARRNQESSIPHVKKMIIADNEEKRSSNINLLGIFLTIIGIIAISMMFSYFENPETPKQSVVSTESTLNAN